MGVRITVLKLCPCLLRYRSLLDPHMVNYAIVLRTSEMYIPNIKFGNTQTSTESGIPKSQSHFLLSVLSQSSFLVEN